MTPKTVQELIETSGGKVDTVAVLPDGSGCATASFPLPRDHWLYAEHANVPPAQLRDLRFVREDIAEAARYAIRASTDNGRIVDFDPDAMVQSMVVGLLGLRQPGAPPRSSFLKDWRPPNALDDTPLGTAADERLRAQAWMNTALEHERQVQHWRAQCEQRATGAVRLTAREVPLLCPACGDEYLHHATITVRSRPKEDGAGTETVILPDGSSARGFLLAAWEGWQGRRDEMTIEVWCEACDARSEVVLMQHKGTTLLSVRSLGPREAADDEAP